MRPAERAIAAARGALCRLGKDAAEALSTIDAWFDEGFMPAKIADSGRWDRLRFRLGAPLASIEFRNDAERDRFAERSLRFDPPQHCDWSGV